MKKISQDTVTIFVPFSKFYDAAATIRENKVRHKPFLRYWGGYYITVENGPVATMLKLKYEK